MGEYFRVEGDVVWNTVAEALEHATADVPPSAKPNCEATGISMLRHTAKTFGGSRVARSVVQHSGDAYDLHWLARAGIASVADTLTAIVHESADPDDVVWAALGLAHLGRDEGFLVLNELIGGQFRVRLPDLESYIDEASLSRLAGPKALSLLQNLKQRRAAARMTSTTDED